MQKLYTFSVTTNISIVLIWASMLLFSEFYYTSFWSDILIVSLLLISGILLFIKGDLKFFKIIVYSELFISPIFYYYLFHKMLIIPILYLILIIGILTKRLDIASLVNLFVVGIFKPVYNSFGTDELMIDYYSAYQFLHGLNPYNPNVTNNVFFVYHVSPYIYGTPYTTGGFVTNLNYPSLSFLLLIPAVLFHFNPNYILLFFYVILPLIMKFKLDNSSFLLFISAYFFNVYYFLYSTGGIDNIVWVTFLIISFLVKDEWLKGVFYGLSVSYKQDPLIFLPFYMIELYREKKNLSKFLIGAIVTFFILNGYFIAISPHYYFTDLLTPLFSNLLEIGFGLDIFSVNGFFYEFKDFFFFTQLFIFSVSLYLFIKRKISNYIGSIYFFMFFMYRMLWNYVMYIPIFNYLDNKVENKISLRKDVIKPLFLVSLVIFSFALIFHYAYFSYYNSIKIEVLHVFKTDGNITAMLVNVSYEGPLNKIKPMFRLFAINSYHGGNGLLWISNSTWLERGEWEIVMIKSPLNILGIAGGGYIIINAYYEDVNGFLYVNVS
ncbi:hypothetical protein SJAV_20130 [Sulfurisphaera javensis]|uniref:DUF2029 domain-containing protein n=1 Tax=Sulfurisphaera javensis TaxID=2049879 RepID=A0AAT9GT28_9CREN